MLVNRVTGSPEGMALKDLLIADKIGATSQSDVACLPQPPGNIFTTAPIYTDQMAAVARVVHGELDRHHPQARVAYLTADSTLWAATSTFPSCRPILEKIGFEFVGAQFVPMVPTAPPTTQLAWLKDNKVDLAIGCMINPGSQPTIKEAVRLGMGPDLAYKITFALREPGPPPDLSCRDMGDGRSGLVVRVTCAPRTPTSTASSSPTCSRTRTGQTRRTATSCTWTASSRA